MIWLGAAVLLAFARPALAETRSAEPGPIAAACHASGALTVETPADWTCERRDWSIAEPRAFLRFDLGGGPAPAELATRLTRFDAMRVTVIGADGRAVSRDLTEADMRPATTDWLMRAPLPFMDRAQTILVRIDAPRHVGMLADMRLGDQVSDTPASLRHELLVALLCGTLCLPLLFNFAFYRVLRERFLLWHAFATGLMLAHTLVTSGLINRFAALSLDQLSVISAVTFGGAIIGAAAFSADLIESEKLDPIHRRLLRGVAWWVAPWTAFYLFAGGAFRAPSAPLYLASFLPLMALFGWSMTTAWQRGSRAVGFQIAAWLPVMITAAIRIASALGATDAPLEMLLEQHLAMGLEVIITFLGVFDRLHAIRRERDLAIAEIRVFEDRAERDPLTALFNRRGVEQRFAQLQDQGFRTMALIDLDRFKQVNDTYGHLTGDRVLRATALALAPDSDTVAVRMGGEEFLLLLRGKNVADRAERRRRGIQTRIAAYIPELENPVTASMGLVEMPESRLRLDFPTLYAQCDRLLYEAKNSGRDKTMSETIQTFDGLRPPQARAA